MKPELFHPPENRLLSIDALRGLTMFFIIGGEGIFHRLFQIWQTMLLRHYQRTLNIEEGKSYCLRGFLVTGCSFPE